MGIKERYARLPPLPPDISRRLEALPSVLVGHPLRLAYLFGSAARDPATASDIDLAVLPADGFSYARLYADLSRALGTDRLDLADMRCASVLLQWEVVTTGRLLEAASPEEAAAYERLVAAAVMAQDLSLRWTVERGLLAGLTIVFQVCDTSWPPTFTGIRRRTKGCCRSCGMRESSRLRSTRS